MQLAASICSGSSAGVMLLVKSELYNDVYARVVEQGVLTLPKPVTRQTLSQSLQVLCATRERLRRMEEKQVSVERKSKRSAWSTGPNGCSSNASP